MLTLRVVRLSRRTPRRSSSDFTCVVTMLVARLSCRAADEKPLSSTTLTNDSIEVTRSIARLAAWWHGLIVSCSAGRSKPLTQSGAFDLTYKAFNSTAHARERRQPDR